MFLASCSCFISSLGTGLTGANLLTQLDCHVGIVALPSTVIALKLLKLRTIKQVDLLVPWYFWLFAHGCYQSLSSVEVAAVFKNSLCCTNGFFDFWVRTI